ncbi:hypothetical protein [Pseudomonas aeruginosa]
MANIVLPVLHAGQREVYRTLGKRDILRCGRRWGKTVFAETIAANWALQGMKIGYFNADYGRLLPSYERILSILKPAVRSASKVDMVITLVTGGRLEFWTLGDPNAGRGSGYHKVILDEASLVPDLQSVFQLSIEPTLLDFDGDAILMGTPLGVDEDSFYYQCCTRKVASEQWPTIWNEHHAPTRSNPLLPAQAVAALQAKYPPKVYAQEFEALFISWSGESLIKLSDLLVNGAGVAYPLHCETVCATIDTAVKDGQEHDGTAVCYWAINKYGGGAPLTLLDWDVVQITSDLQVGWIPSVIKRCEELAVTCKARYGSIGAFIEDKQSGQMLLQHGARVGWDCTAIPADLTAIGKSGRASLASGPCFEGRVKLSQFAFDKVVDYKGQVKNHLVSQVTSFSLGDKAAYRRADDAADAFFYGVLVSLEGEQPLLS